MRKDYTPALLRFQIDELVLKKKIANRKSNESRLKLWEKACKETAKRFEKELLLLQPMLNTLIARASEPEDKDTSDQMKNWSNEQMQWCEYLKEFLGALDQKLKEEMAVMAAKRILIDTEEKENIMPLDLTIALPVNLSTTLAPTKPHSDPVDFKLTAASTEMAPSITINALDTPKTLKPFSRLISPWDDGKETMSSVFSADVAKPIILITDEFIPKNANLKESWINDPKTPEKSIKPKTQLAKSISPSNRNTIEIQNAPTFIDGDGSIKSITDNNDNQKTYKPRFGNADLIDTVILGSNGTRVALNRINWSAEPSACARKVLLTVFDRAVLATSNLSGQGSHAFMGVDKPKKAQLDAKKVADVVEFMCEQVGMSKKEVRQVIVHKCNDETKMLRDRLKRKLVSDEVSDKDYDEEIKQPAEKKRKLGS